MVLKYIEHPEIKTVEIHIDGKVTHEEFDSVIIDVGEFIQNFKTIKLLERVETFKVGMDMSMMWEGMKFDLKNIRHISHCAVVSDIGWLSPLSKAAGAFVSTKLRTFSMDEIDAARAWLKDPDSAG
ncbi:STAS/SEC14 domain-containing protein [Profundibacter sp.]